MMMFSRTVNSMSSVSCGGTTPRRGRISAPRVIGSSPRMRSVPPDGGETQPIMRIVEVLPAPFGPRKPNASPRSTSKSTPSTATSSPNRFTSPRAWTSGSCSVASATPATYRPRRCVQRAVAFRAMQAAVAGGHPATVAAGIEILEDGGNAADAAVAASLASCVTETVMTGLLGGGHAGYFDAPSGRARNLDCFVAVPGLGEEPREAEMIHLDVLFGAELVHYAVGPASCAVPGLPAGLEALSRRHGRLPWRRVVEPALRLARDGVDFPRAHAACLAMLAPVMTMNEGAEIYAPGGELLQAGDRLEQPGLVVALEALADDAASVYSGTIAAERLALPAERNGFLTPADFDAYEPHWADPVEVGYAGGRVATRGGLSGVPETVRRLPDLRGLDGTERVLALFDVFGTPADLHGDTTNVSVVDREGNACAFTSSLELGSGDFIPGLDLHL